MAGPQDNTGLGRGLLWCSAVYLVANAVGAGLDLYADGGGFGAAAGDVQWQWAAPVIALSSLLGLGAVLAVWIVGSLWLARAWRNAALLARHRLRLSAVWAWLGWWVPIVSFWFPKWIIDDCWRITTEARGGGSALSRPRSTGLWWGLWVGYDVLTLWNPTAWMPEVTLFGMHQAVAVGQTILVTVLGVAAYVAWVPVVRGLSRAQAELAGRSDLPAR